MKKLVLLAVLAQGLALSSTSAQAVEAFDQGWYTDCGSHSPWLLNHVAGDTSYTIEHYYRNFFVFEVPPDTGQIHAAAIVIYQPPVGYSSSHNWEDFGLFEVDTDLSLLLNGTGGVAAYDDLGTGVPYGQIRLRRNSNDSCVTIHLNRDAIRRIGERRGELFAVGGHVLSLDNEPHTGERVFSSTGDVLARLIIDDNRVGPQGVLVIGDGIGQTAFQTTRTTFTTQLDGVHDFVFLGESAPTFPLPGNNEELPPVLVPTDPDADPDPRYAVAPPWMADREFSVQVLVHDPVAYPDQPIRWSEGLRVCIRADGSLCAVPFGQGTGVKLGMETFTGAGEDVYVRFPFELPVVGPTQGALTAHDGW